MGLVRALAASAGVLVIGAALAEGATLSTGTGDGSVIVEVDATGYSTSALYDPLGDVAPADTFFESGVYIPTGGGRSFLGNSNVAQNVNIVSEVRATQTELVSTFTVGQLFFTLTQTLTDSRDPDTGDVTGSVLTQEYRIRNDGVENSFDLVRYLDADLDFDGDIDDSGGVIQAGGTRVLFEIEADNVPGNETTFVGINASTSGQNTNTTSSQNFEMNEYPQLQFDIEGGATLQNEIEGDVDGDGFIDGTYDVTMALQNFLTIPENGVATYTTQTLFGNAVPPTPGSSEALPILPDVINESGGFEFALNAEDLVPGQVVWIDPIIAVGYTYEVTGAEFAGVRLPSFDTVPDRDYIVRVDGMDINAMSGEEIRFASVVDSFQILGIDESLMLDPEDTTAFATGIIFGDGITAEIVGVTQTPIERDINGGPGVIPLPAGIVLLGSAIGMLGLRRKRALN